MKSEYDEMKSGTKQEIQEKMKCWLNTGETIKKLREELDKRDTELRQLQAMVD